MLSSACFPLVSLFLQYLSFFCCCCHNLFSLALFVTCSCSCCRWLYCCCITKMRGRHFKAAALHGKTPRRDQNPVLAISSFGPIKTCATRSSSRQNTREPGSLRADQMNAWTTFQRSGPSTRSKNALNQHQRYARYTSMAHVLDEGSPGCTRAPA